MTFKVFKNGNINYRFSREEREEIRLGYTYADEVFVYDMEDADLEIIGDEYTVGNFEMARTLYNPKTEKVYILLLGEMLKAVSSGKTIKLYASTPSEDQREEIEKEGF